MYAALAALLSVYLLFACLKGIAAELDWRDDTSHIKQIQRKVDLPCGKYN